MTCQETVNSVMADLRQQGATVTFLVYDQDYYVQFARHRLENQKRVNGLALILGASTQSNTTTQNTWRSEESLKSYANQIFPRCGGTSIIDFEFQETDVAVSFAMSDKNQLGREACYEPTESIPPAISEIYREWDWYCAYVL